MCHKSRRIDKVQSDGSDSDGDVVLVVDPAGSSALDSFSAMHQMGIFGFRAEQGLNTPNSESSKEVRL